MISAQIRKSFYLFSKKTYFLPREPLIAHHFFSTSTKEEGKQKDSTVALFLKELGLSDTQLEKVFKQRIQLVSANIEKSIKPKIKVFHDFGFSNPEIAEIVGMDPAILCSSVSRRLIPSLSYLNDLLGSSSHDVLFKITKRMARFFAFDMRKHFLPNMELLNTHGVPIERIVYLLSIQPGCLYIPHKTLRRRIDKLEILGLHPSSKSYTHAFWVFGYVNPDVLDQKMQVLRELGFTETEILDMLKKRPHILLTSDEKLKDITAMLLATEKYSKASLVTYPMAFSSSIEKRLKPRLDILKLLEKMNLIKKWPALGFVSNHSDERFHDKFMAPYLNQLEEAYAANKETLMIPAGA